MVVVTGRFAGDTLDLGDATLDASAKNFVVALDIATGATRWSLPLASPAASPVGSADIVVVPRFDATVLSTRGVALDLIDAGGSMSTDTVTLATHTNYVDIVAHVLGASDRSLWLSIGLATAADGVTSYDLEVDSARYSGPDNTYFVNVLL